MQLFSRAMMLLCLAFPVTAGLAPPGAAAQEARPGMGGVIANSVQAGSFGAFELSQEPGKTVLVNKSAPGAFRFYKAQWTAQANASERAASVRMDVPEGGKGGSGIALRFSNDDLNWLGAVVTGDATLEIYEASPGHSNRIAAFSLPRLDRSAGVLLQVIDAVDGTTIYVDGRKTASLSADAGADGKLRPERAVAVLAMGEGRFGFRTFDFSPLQPPRAGDGGPPPQPTQPVSSPGLAGPLANVIAAGASGAWTVALDPGYARLSNTSESSAVRFNKADWVGAGGAKGRSVSLRLDPPEAGAVGSGLILRMQDQDPRWLAAVITGKRKLALFARTASGLSPEGERDLPAPGPGGYLLQMSETAEKAMLIVNGREIMEIRRDLAADGSLAPARPAGIVALGKGNFGFRSFEFGPAIVLNPAAGGGDDTVGLPPGGGDDTVNLPTGGDPPKPQPPAPKEKQSPIQLQAGGALLGIIAHEFGHFLIGELKLASTGQEEDVADDFAAQVFIDNARQPSPEDNMTPAEIKESGLGAAKFWLFMANAREAKKQESPWFDEHSPDKRRFGSFLCHLYGAFPVDFKVVMDRAEIPEPRRQRCVADRIKADRAWGELLRSHRRKGVIANQPGDMPVDAPGGSITVEYGEAKTEKLKIFADSFRESKAMDTVAKVISKLYVLPRDTKLITKECGFENAFYQPGDGSVTICYEIVDAVITAFVKAETGGGQGGGGGGGGDAPKPAPVDLGQFLTGTWHIEVYQEKGGGEVNIEYRRDGSAVGNRTVMTQLGPFQQEFAGSWAARSTGENKAALTFAPTRWQPQQLCMPEGFCTPMPLSRNTAQIELLDKNTFKSESGIATRIQ